MIDRILLDIFFSVNLCLALVFSTLRIGPPDMLFDGNALTITMAAGAVIFALMLCRCYQKNGRFLLEDRPLFSREWFVFAAGKMWALALIYASCLAAAFVLVL